MIHDGPTCILNGMRGRIYDACGDNRPRAASIIEHIFGSKPLYFMVAPRRQWRQAVDNRLEIRFKSVEK